MRRYLHIALALFTSGLLSACAASPGRRDVAGGHGAAARPTAGATSPAVQRSPAERDAALPRLTAESTLGDYLTYAALNNPGLRADFQNWRAAVEKIPQVTALPDPMLSFGYFLEEVETRVGPQEWRASLTQKFPWFGKLDLRGRVAARAADAAWKRYQAAKLVLFHRVTKAYAEYYYLRQAIQVTRENRDIVKQLESVARAKYRTGIAQHADVIRAQVQLGKLDDRLASLEDLRGPRSARLNAALGRRADAPLPWPRSLPQPDGQLPSQQQLMARMQERNPELEALRAETEKGRAGVELAGKEYYPDLTVGLSYMDTGGARMPGVSDSGKDPVAVTLGINLPIWRDSYRAGEREALAGLRKARRSLEDRARTLESEAKLALYDVRDARRRIGLYRDTLIPKARQSLRANETAFRAGNIDFLSVLDSQRELLQFELSHRRASADHVESVARLEMLVGGELMPPSGQQPREEPGNEG